MSNIECIIDSNLSIAWGKLFKRTMQPGCDILQPIVVSIVNNGDKSPTEELNIRKELDRVLKIYKNPSISETAATIFPYNLWRIRGKPNCEELTRLYLQKYMPRHKARVRLTHHKWQETYFARMVDYHGLKETKNSCIRKDINQLLHLIEIWRPKKRPRHSALQVTIFDPAKDHTGSAMSGFPCLQQLSFGYDNNNNLSINAYYPTQYIVDRAYGNYLGLYRLGIFMALELDMTFSRLNCFIARPFKGKPNKAELVRLIMIVNEALC